MKTFVLALALLVSRTALADDDPLLLRAQELESNGHTMRLEGILMSGIGTVLLAGTAALWINNEQCQGPPQSECNGAKWILLTAGLPATAFGLTMWWLGQNEIHQAQRLRAWGAPTKNGAMAGFGVSF
jgi:hypothetical protein